MEFELTKEQLERQDFVDNQIYNLMLRLNPTNENLNWNIEFISRIRNEVQDIFNTDLKLCDENSFYPFIIDN